jgi:hypothetical protein
MKLCTECKKKDNDCPYPDDYKELMARHTGDCINFVSIGDTKNE